MSDNALNRRVDVGISEPDMDNEEVRQQVIARLIMVADMGDEYGPEEKDSFLESHVM